MNRPILVTGAAGFIGHAVAHRLMDRGDDVIGVDIVNDYYDPALKAARLASLVARKNFRFFQIDVADAEALAALTDREMIVRVVHLAAQAGVRYSISNPFDYEHSNLRGHLSVLEACRHSPRVEHLVYASSSSVYGDRAMPEQGFSEEDPASSPVSLYAATKRACELMSQSYATLYRLPQTGLRFFTVYGPWGRPDMAYYSFTGKILAGEPIEVFGDGRMARDFTYIDDIVDGIMGVLDTPPPSGEHRILNVGDSNPVGLMDMIGTLEKALGRPAIKIMRPMQPGDVTSTFADIRRINHITGYQPKIDIQDGLGRFVSWYRDFHKYSR